MPQHDARGIVHKAISYRYIFFVCATLQLNYSRLWVCEANFQFKPAATTAVEKKVMFLYL